MSDQTTPRPVKIMLITVSKAYEKAALVKRCLGNGYTVLPVCQDYHANSTVDECEFIIGNGKCNMHTENGKNFEGSYMMKVFARNNNVIYISSFGGIHLIAYRIKKAHKNQLKTSMRL